MKKIKRNILCIDLKSFFASVECVDLGLDPFKVPLVVANINQGKGAITLAVTPYLKQFGIKGRTRLYEIPKEISYKIVNPRMKRYIEMSKKVVSIYLNFISTEDLHIYSIDECFLDVTDYLHYYNKTDYELALDILKEVKEKTGLCATCGIGPNMLLAKVAMDIEAKHTKDNIAKWTYQEIETKLWQITPLSKFWGIGSRLEKKLNNLGMFSIADIAKKDLSYLKSKFGILGEELWYHANGIDEAIIKDFKNTPKNKSFSHSQVLFQDYYPPQIFLLFYEMLETLTERLRKKNMLCQVLGLGVTYSKGIGGGFYHSIKLTESTDQIDILFSICKKLFYSFYTENSPIRKISISLGKLSPKDGIQLNLFHSLDEERKKENFLKSVDEINLKYGNNSVLRASSLESYSTKKEQNQKIGGHHA